MHQLLEQQLQELGIEENRARIYLACLELGKGTVIEIAKKAGVKRTTVYDNLSFLLRKSLITEIYESNHHYFVANPPKRIRDLVKEKEELAKEILPQLNSLFSAFPAKPKIQYFHGTKGIQEAAWDPVSCTSKEVYYVGDMKEYYTILRVNDFNKTFVEERVKRGIFAYGIVKDDNDVLEFLHPSKNNSELREVRIAPRTTVLKIFMQLYDYKVGVISTKGEGYALIIESRDFFETQKSFFDTLWSISKQYK